VYNHKKKPDLSAFPEAALLGATLGKALKMSIYSKIAP
jgi:hypothetical protein